MKTHKPQILIVDDNIHFQHTLADILEAKGYQVQAASRGKEALALAREGTYEAALIDLRLQDIPGLEVLDAVQEIDPLIHCILMTGHASQDAAIQALNRGAYYFMQKPLDFEQLLLIIRNAVGARQSEVELRKSEAVNRSITEAIPDCLLELDQRSRILHLQQPGDKALFLPQVKTGVTLSDLLPDQHARMMLEMIAHTLEVESLQELEFPMKRGDERRDFEIRMVPKGKRQVLALVRDITDQKEFQREAEQRRQYLEGVLQAAPDAIITLDSDHRVMEWNQGAQRVFGFQEGEAMGRDLDELIIQPGSDYTRQGKELTSQVLQGQVVSPTETIRFRKDGQPIHVIVAGAPIMRDEELVGAVATYTNITDRVHAEQALARSEERYRGFMDNFDGIIYRSGPGFNFSFLHGAVKEITGYTENEFLSGRLDWLSIIHPEDRELFLDGQLIQNSPDRTVEREYRIKRKEGDFRWVNEVLQIIREEDDKIYLQAMIRDISDQKSLQNILDWQLRVNRDVAELSHKIIESAPIDSISRMVMTKAKQLTGSTFGFVGYANPTNGELMSLAISDEVWEYYPPDTEEEIIRSYRGLWQDILEGGDSQLINEISEEEKRRMNLDGKLPVSKILSSPVYLDDRVVGFITLLNPGEDYISRDLQVVMYLADIYALALGRKETEQQLRYMATHDDLTDLPNRVYFNNTINQALAQVSGQDLHLAVMLLDVDKFKQVNDTYGHGVGDEVLKRTAGRLQRSLRKSDTIARWGGDEFVIIVESDSAYQGSRVVVDKILEAFSVPMNIRGSDISVGVSIGISLYPKDGRDGDTLIRRADAAMYTAKKEGLSFCNYSSLSSGECPSGTSDSLRPIKT